MPIEINELTIRARVENRSEQTDDYEPYDTPGTTLGQSSGGISEDLIAECVERVLEIIKNQKER